MNPFIVAPSPPTGLRPLHISGNRLKNDLGQIVQLQGVMLRRSHWYCDDGGLFIPQHFQVIRDNWNCNAVKILVNPFLWVSGCPYRTYEPNSAAYRQMIMNAVAMAQAQGLYVLLTIMDYYMPGGSNWPNPRYNAIQCIQGDPTLGIPGIGQIYATDGTVIIETFSEPNPYWTNTETWLHGGTITNFTGGNTYTSVGAQDLCLAMTRVAPNKVFLLADVESNEYPGYVTAGNWPLADNSGFSVNNTNYGWSLHCYRGGDNATQSNWDNTFGFLSNQHLVIAGEFGDVSGMNSDTSWIDALMPYMQSHIAGWFVWAWDTNASPCILDTTDPQVYLTGKPSTYGQSIWNFYHSNGVVQR